MKSICVFCGSSTGRLESYLQAAQQMGAAIAAQGLTLVYGGGNVGLMGAVANAALASGGRVHGIMPRELVEREIAHKGLTELIVVNTMHERKTKMAELSDAFVALPGGAGTMEEIFEQWTWAQLGIHRKACGILNVNGYFDPLLNMIDHMVSEQFLRSEYRDMLAISNEPLDLIWQLQAHRPPPLKWAFLSSDRERNC